MAEHRTLDPFLAGLKILARRELSTTQVSHRLHKRGFSKSAIDAAVIRLQTEGALDDHRTATAYARVSLDLKLRGRQRVLRELEERIGVDRVVARTAVDEVYANVEERDLVERVLNRRHTVSVSSGHAFRRLYHALLRQGFEANVVVSALKARATDSGLSPNDEQGSGL